MYIYMNICICVYVCPATWETEADGLFIKTCLGHITKSCLKNRKRKQSTIILEKRL